MSQKLILRILLFQALIVAAATSFAVENKSVDEQSGLVIDEGWELARAHCGACHSYRLLTQNRGDYETWLGLIRWMQETQGFWELSPETEDELLTYLAKHYSAAPSQRRLPLAPELMPPSGN